MRRGGADRKVSWCGSGTSNGETGKGWDLELARVKGGYKEKVRYEHVVVIVCPFLVFLLVIHLLKLWLGRNLGFLNCFSGGGQFLWVHIVV